MAITYTAATEVAPGPQATAVHASAINIRITRDDRPTMVSFLFEAVDAEGEIVNTRKIVVPITDIVSEVASFQATYDALEAEAYRQAATIFPSA